MSKNKNNQIKKVVSRVTFRQAEERDIEYWQNVSAEDKLSEVERLRNHIGVGNWAVIRRV